MAGQLSKDVDSRHRLFLIGERLISQIAPTGVLPASAARATAAAARQRSLDFLNPGVPEGYTPEASRNQGARTTASMVARSVVADLSVNVKFTWAHSARTGPRGRFLVETEIAPEAPTNRPGRRQGSWGVAPTTKSDRSAH